MIDLGLSLLLLGSRRVCPQHACSLFWAQGSKSCGQTVIFTLMVPLMRPNNSWAVLAMQTFLYNKTQITIQKDFQWVLGRWKYPPWPPLPSCPAANAPMETNSLLCSAGSKPDQWQIWGTASPSHPNPPPPVKPSDLTNSLVILKQAGRLIPLQRMDGIKDSKTSLFKSLHLEDI